MHALTFLIVRRDSAASLLITLNQDIMQMHILSNLSFGEFREPAEINGEFVKHSSFMQSVCALHLRFIKNASIQRDKNPRESLSKGSGHSV